MVKRHKQDRKREEFSELVLEHMNSLYNLAYRLTYNREAASDLVQEACFRAYKNYDTFQQGTNFKAWILTILRNIFINDYRKMVKGPVQINYDEYESGLDHLFSVEGVTGAQEEIFGEAVQKSIEKLPEELRTVVVLFYVDGLAYKEIAKVMSCPMGTVMSRLHIARQILKKELSRAVKRGELA